jgi:hypothetical protein
VEIREQGAVQLGFPTSQYLTVVTDYGPVKGASRGRHVKASDGRNYYIKGRSFRPQWRYVASNEFIAARLGLLLGIPMPRFEIVEFQGAEFFGSEEILNRRFATSRRAVVDCENALAIYDLVAFDAFVINADRHDENVFIVERGKVETLVLMDHSHAILPEENRAMNLHFRVNDPISDFQKLAYLPQLIERRDLLYNSISRIEALTDVQIRDCCENMPSDWLTTLEQDQIATFLCARRNVLRILFQNDRHTYPRLSGSTS